MPATQEWVEDWGSGFYLLLCFIKILFILFMRNPEREAETQAEGEAGSMQGG